MGNTDMVELNKLGGGKWSHTPLTPAKLSAPPLTPTSSTLQKINELTLEQVGKGASETTTLLTKAKLNAPPLSFISILFSKDQ
jgi:hypothetical protein